MVFQNPAPDPHLTVLENMGFSVRGRRMPKAERLRRVGLVAEILGIDHLLAPGPRISPAENASGSHSAGR